MTVTFNEKVIIAAAESPVLDVHNTTNAASNQVAVFRAHDRTAAQTGDEGYFSFIIDDEFWRSRRRSALRLEAVRCLWHPA